MMSLQTLKIIFQSGKTLISNFLSDATENMQGKVLIKRVKHFSLLKKSFKGSFPIIV